jgi:hypothetical protein
LLNFADYEFPAGGGSRRQWVDIKRFLITTSVDDRELLGSLLATEQFRDSYLGAGVEPAGVVHGPYRRDRLSPDSYNRASPDLIVDLVTAWVNNCGAVPPTLWEAVDRAVFAPVREAHDLFLLRQLDPSAIADYGFIHTEFHEIVTVDRDEHLLRLIVVADD